MKFRKNRVLLDLALGILILVVVQKERRDARAALLKEDLPTKEDTIRMNLTPRRIYRQDQEAETGGIHLKVETLRKDPPSTDGKALLHVTFTLTNRSKKLYHYDPENFKRMRAPAADFEPLRDEAGQQYVEVDGTLKETLTYRIEKDLSQFLLLFLGPEKDIIAIELRV